MSPYFPLGPFLALSCLGFLTFLPPFSLRPIVSLLQLRQDCNTSRSRGRRALRSDSLRAHDFIILLAVGRQYSIRLFPSLRASSTYVSS
jgi:hypothetical protein